MRKPELLAPAGNSEALHSALVAGADAVYFGLSEGFNARAKSANFSLDSLAETIEEIHSCGAKAYITLNTLIFEDELPQVIAILKAVQEARADAIIVQDIGLCLLAQRYAPALRLHASTQMTVSCAQAMDFARQLGLTRVVLPRELSLQDIATIARSSPLETEVFILGALCLSYSGQCLASLAWGGRSANRGQCAQPCRLPYQAIIDGQKRVPNAHPAHLLSPQDQACLTEVEELAQLGVTSLKVEGRLKGPAYVYMATTAVRHQIDAPTVSEAKSLDDRTAQLRRDLTDLALTFSRGFGHGYLRGIDHKRLVTGQTPQHHGVFLGRILSLRGRTITLPRPDSAEEMPRHRQQAGQYRPNYEERQQPLPVTPRPGMGVLIMPAPDSQSFQSPNTGRGGPIFEVQKKARTFELTFGHIGPSLVGVQPGDEVYITSSPQLEGEINQALKGKPLGRIPLSLSVSGSLGQPLRVVAATPQASATVESKACLQKAQRQQLDESSLLSSLGAWGGTAYHLESFSCQGLHPGLFLPLSELKPLRRQLAQILSQSERQAQDTQHQIKPEPFQAFPPATPYRAGANLHLPHLIVLCRTLNQAEAALDMGIEEIELEYYPQHPDYAKMEKCVRHQPQVNLSLCTPRLFRTDEEHLLERLANQNSNSIMVRNLGALVYLRRRSGELHLDGDFSLNVTNSLSARYFFSCGLERLTVSDDIDLKRLSQLALALRKYRAEGKGRTEPGDNNPDNLARLSHRLIVPIYRHIPAFHTQHCFYAQHLSENEHPQSGTCGMVCKQHSISMQDRLGQIHPVLTDMACRNTIYDGKPRNTIEHLPIYLSCGLRQFRLEFLQETGAEVRTLIDHARQRMLGN